MCCRHGITLRAANMFRGETYRIIAFLHAFALKSKVLFFCYDVICRYWPFAQKLGQKNPNFAEFTTLMKPFLSRFHGKAHEWICQVILLLNWGRLVNRYVFCCTGIVVGALETRSCRNFGRGDGTGILQVLQIWVRHKAYDEVKYVNNFFCLI